LFQAKGKTRIPSKLGAPTVLTEEEEEIIVRWIIKIGRAGFPVTKDQVISSVTKVVQKLNRPNPFKDGIPGRFWWEGFERRHPQLSIRVPQNLTLSRATVTESQLRSWFAEVEDHLLREGLFEILQDPTRVFNADESAFFLNPKSSHVVVGRGEKNVYSIVNTDEKECLTVLINGSAGGSIAPSMVIFKNLRLSSELTASVPSDWGIGRSPESGWMTAEHFYEYVANVFEPWLTEQQIVRPIIFFVDGHSSHMTLHLSELCEEKQIILVALYPNSTHILQPCDVAVFRTLKAGWRDERASWRLENMNMEGGRLKKTHFCGLLEKVIKKKVTPEILKNGFRKTGLVPWNPDAIDYTKIPSINEESLSVPPDSVDVFDNDFFNKLEKAIGVSKVIEFRQCQAEKGSVSIEDTSLFSLWLKSSQKSNVIPPEATLTTPLLSSALIENVTVVHEEPGQSTSTPNPRGMAPKVFWY